jgi:hypothetical protein
VQTQIVRQLEALAAMPPGAVKHHDDIFVGVTVSVAARDKFG